MAAIPILYICIIFFFANHLYSATAENNENIRALLDRECTNLNKEKLFGLLRKTFSKEIEQGIEPELFKIMEGVIKRTDFDGISEERTSEIIRLVYDAFKKGAPLDYLDQIFDVAYTKDVGAGHLFAAANALQEFYNSDVPGEIYEEFVYHSMEERWEPEAMPVLTKGLIYGVDRGLTPQKVAMAILVDVDQGGLKKKAAKELISEAVEFVRKVEPEKWRPFKETEREMMMREEEKARLERLRQEAESLRKMEEEAERRRKELEEKSRLEEKLRLREDMERIAQEREKANKKRAEILRKYQEEQRRHEAALEKTMREVARDEERRKAEREARRSKELNTIGQHAAEYGRKTLLNVERLYSAVARYLGIPYRFGGDSEDGIDCSAFTRRVYREQGINLPRTSREQAMVGRTVTNNVFQSGDLVFFDTSIIGTISHVGIYLEDNMFVHASRSRGVTKSSLRERYYSKRFVRANRIFIQ